MSKKYLDALCRDGQTVNPLFSHLGISVVRLGDGEAELRMPVNRNSIQGGGMVAGGILATLADEAMAHAVMTALGDDAKTVTSEMNIRYLRGAAPSEGQELKAVAGVLRLGRRICVAEARVWDARERLLAVAGASFFLPESQGNVD